MKTKIERLQFSRPRKFLNNKILIGNWFEEQSSYHKNKFIHDSEYRHQYKMKPLSTYPPEIMWDARIRAEGIGIHSKMVTCDELPNFYENFSTTYDLSYNHFPNYYRTLLPNKERVKSSIPPPEEMIKSYGNLTKYGLLAHKRQEWNCDMQDPRTTCITTNENTYFKPEYPSYKFPRWTRLTSVHGKYGKVYKPLPEDHPRMTKCNPLTWECRNEMCEKCCCL